MTRRLFLNCARNYTCWQPSKPNQSPIIKKIINEYDYYAPKIIDSTMEKMPFVLSDEIKKRTKKSLEYYLHGRKPVQGEFMVFAYEAMNNDKNITDEMFHQLQVVVATSELIQSYYFLWDDLEDSAEIRLGKTCWHLLDNNGMLAYNDACIMRSFINEIVRQNFKSELRENILSIYNEVYFAASLGQYEDAILARSRNYDKYTIQQYDFMNNFKSSYFSINMPLLLALALNHNLNQESYNIVNDTCIDIGILYQIHNDMLDYIIARGSSKRKSNSDIQQGKCTWIAVAVLERCNPEQRRIFTENYGNRDPEKVERVLQLYDEMNVKQLYEQEEKKRMNKFKTKINALPENCTPSAEFLKRFCNLFQFYSQDTDNLMYDKH